MSQNPVDFRKNDHGFEIDLPIEVSSKISQATRDAYKDTFIQLMTAKLASSCEEICYMQPFNRNPSLIRLRLLRERETMEENARNATPRLQT